jgi:hypothetical protein
MKEQLTQEENDIHNLDAVVDHLTRSRNKTEALKMVTHGFGVTRVAKSTFFSVFTLPTKKRGPQQGQLREFLKGIQAPFAPAANLLPEAPNPRWKWMPLLLLTMWNPPLIVCLIPPHCHRPSPLILWPS